jgi:ADP-ribosylglycohydrolase/ActR/RegA family two-component response regulator
MDRQQRRLEAARDALEGLSVGDALGERFFGPEESVRARIQRRELPAPTWRHTDDTEMAVAIFETLARFGWMHQDELALAFAGRYLADPRRGYGYGARELLEALAEGASWRESAASLFDGSGSYGNGAAMRVAPLGAYFHDNRIRCAGEAEKSAEVTHTHTEGKAGAIAVANTSRMAVKTRGLPASEARERILEQVLYRVPEGDTRRGIEVAAAIDPGADVDEVARRLGNGSNVSAQDTVPFALWAALSSLDSYCEAFWKTVSALGDRDTTCAIVGGIVASRVGRAGIPDEWLAARELLPIPKDLESIAGLAERRLKRVLVIDDNADIGKYVEYALRGRFAVFSVPPNRVMETYEPGLFDLVTTGYNLGHPGDGYEMIDRIRAKSPEQAMIMMSGWTSRDNVAEAARRGVKWITKGCKIEELVDLITEVIGESRTEDE